MILVTGAGGFVGTALSRTLVSRGVAVLGAVRNGAGLGKIAVGDLDAGTDWRAALKGCDAVVHLAARVHVMSDQSHDPILAYRTVNVDATMNLARQAVDAGVKRFVFVSSVKVNGESTRARPFRGSDVPMPGDPYGQTKMEAEQGLQELARETGLEVVIVRPPLVYGPGVKANFLNLMKLVQIGVPLPFGRVSNLRSMVAVDNLVDLLIVCSTHPHAPGNIFMVSDGADMDMKALVTQIASAMNRRVLFMPIPLGFMVAIAKLLRKQGVLDRLLSSLQVDMTLTQATLNWQPVVTPQAAIEKTVEHFRLVSGRKTI
jgi:nucleoside-diphosphate-sugar epimerase